jgi:hypothetical protein
MAASATAHYPKHTLQYRIQNTETHVHKITIVPVFYMALGLNDFDAGKSITQATPSNGPLNRFAGIKIITSCAV